MIRTLLFAALGSILATPSAAQPMDAGREASQFVPIIDEPPAELFIDPPLAGPLARGAVIIPYRTNHFRILPIFGAGAVDVSPRAGHLHVGRLVEPLGEHVLVDGVFLQILGLSLTTLLAFDFSRRRHVGSDDGASSVQVGFVEHFEELAGFVNAPGN